jgi:conjugative transfer signal peptidase TraF
MEVPVMSARSVMVVAMVGLGLLILTATFHPSIGLAYNPTDSAPRGLYLVLPASRLNVGDYVIARLPQATAKLAAARGYLPQSVPVLKQIAARAGQRVCIENGVVYVDRDAVARTLSVDGQRRPLSPWRHCRRLLDGELFLLNPANPASFDSRYFGPIDVTFVRGRARLLLQWP